jgi:hypothetical protein
MILVRSMVEDKMSTATQPAAERHEVLGWVVRTIRVPRGEPNRFTVKTSDGQEWKAICPFFCPVEEGDSIAGTITMTADREFTYVSQPFVQIPVSGDNVKACFIRALRSSGFGQISADDLYNKIMTLARAANQAKVTLEARKKAATAKPLSLDRKLPLPVDVKKPESIDVKKPEPIDVKKDKQKKDDLEKAEQKKIEIKALTEGTDGVVGYLSELAAMYNRSYDDSIVKGLVAGTKLKEEQVAALLRWWHQHRSLRRLHLLGLTNKEIKACMKPLDEVYEICITNPFKLAPIPIDKAKAIVKSMRSEPQAIDILCGCIVRKIYEMMEQMGWVCMPFWMLQKTYSTIYAIRELLVSEYDVVFEREMAYLAYPYKVEVGIANWLDKQIKKTAVQLTKPSHAILADGKTPKVDTPELETALYECKTLTDEQKTAIQGVLECDVSIVRGGSGVGKSSLIKELIRNLEIRDIGYAVTAFTGKAVSRVQEILKKRVAWTMDRMIVKAGQVQPFKHLIVDEVGMLTTELMYRFRQAHPGAHDENQLQPIGWGCLMRQMLYSGRVPTYTLTINHRIINSTDDAKFDKIILENANALIDSKRDLQYPLAFRQGTGFYQLEGDVDTVHQIVKVFHKNGIPESQISVICPYVVDGYLEKLNMVFQQVYLDQAKQMVDQKKQVWSVGMRVMMLKNSYSINVFNGETGYVCDLTDDGVVVKFRDELEHLFLYESSDPHGGWKKKGEAFDEGSDEVELTIEHIQAAFAGTVHKNQGSENDFIIGYIPERANKFGKVGSSFLNINLLYTLITRTRKAIYLVGSSRAIDAATCKMQASRYENLSARLRVLKDDKLEAVLAKLTNIDASIAEPEEPDDISHIHDDAGVYS